MIFLYSIYYLIAGGYILYMFKKYYITPSLIFVMTQVIMFVGITNYIDVNLAVDRKLICVYLVSLICYVISSAFHYHRYGIKHYKVEVTRDGLTQTQKYVIWLMVIVSIAACVYLFASAGGNVFLQSFKALVGDDSYSIKFGRKNILGVAGVGYVYQFRTVILPILTVYLINAGTRKEKRWAWLIFPLMIMFILGTGQRGGFVMFVLMWGVALLYIHKYYNEGNLKRLFLIGALFFIIFSLMTVLNGRVSDGSVIKAMAKRVLDDNQACAVYGFRYIVNQPIQWGADWFNQIIDILPGKNEYQALSVKIFAIMNGGSTAGTAPPCIWGSAFYNWGWLGVTIFPAILAHFHAYIYRRFMRKKSNKIRLFLYAGAFVILGMWIADGPMVLFNQGFVTIILMLLVIKISKRFVIRR